MSDEASFSTTQHFAAFPEHSHSSPRSLPDVIDAARRFSQSRFPGSSLTLLGGSWAHGRAHAESDIDLVVVDSGLNEIRFECLLFESWVIDVCSLPPRLMETFFRGSAKYRNAPVPNKVLDGIVVLGDQDAATEAKLLASEVLSEGPHALNERESLDCRWALTCLLIDLAHAPDPELLGLAAQCHAQLAQAVLDSARAWRGERKNLLRSLVATAPDLAEQLDGALRAAFLGDRRPLLGIGRQVLEALGGYQRTYAESYLPAVNCHS